MELMRLGLDRKGNRLFQDLEEDIAHDLFARALQERIEELSALARVTLKGATFRGEVERRTIDPGDCRTAGWTYVVSGSDPRREEYTQVLRPLAERRGMSESGPLIYDGEPIDEWLTDSYFALELDREKVPLYVLIVGGPDRVPFRFQSVLDTVSNVGRVDLDAEGLENYVQKILRLEEEEDPVTDRLATLFAPDGGPQDPTYFSCKHMVKPLAKHVKEVHDLRVDLLAAEGATKSALAERLSSCKPALVYTASHGMGAFGAPEDVMHQVNGAICCQADGSSDDWLFTAEDVPPDDEPFLEGAVFFQFACFGYGTPAESDFAHWLKEPQTQYAEEDFIAALPRRLISHPRGPISYIGHLDTAFLHGFTDQHAPHILERWHDRVAPFVSTVDQLLGVQPSGLAMQAMSSRYGVYNALLTNVYDRLQRGKLKWTKDMKQRFVDAWIIRSDAQNYMVYGDPAARLRVPSA